MNDPPTLKPCDPQAQRDQVDRRAPGPIVIQRVAMLVDAQRVTFQDTMNTHLMRCFP